MKRISNGRYSKKFRSNAVKPVVEDGASVYEQKYLKEVKADRCLVPAVDDRPVGKGGRETEQPTKKGPWLSGTFGFP